MIWILAALLTGPFPEPNLKLTVHLGRDRNSAVFRSELGRHDAWSIEHRLAIGRTHRLLVDDDEFSRPTYQIGSGQRLPFPRGACAASGTAMLTLRSIAETDAWEREYVSPWGHWKDGEYEELDPEHEKRKPFQFPGGQ